MDNNNMNPRQTGVSFGSGGPLLGAPASQVLAQPGAMQQTPSSPGFQPGLIPPQVHPMPTQMGQPSMGMPQQPQQPQQNVLGNPQAPQGVVGMPQGNPETQMILKALASRLASLTKGEELQRGQ